MIRILLDNVHGHASAMCTPDLCLVSGLPCINKERADATWRNIFARVFLFNKQTLRLKYSFKLANLTLENLTKN